MSGETDQLPKLSEWGGNVYLVRRYAVDGDTRWSAFNPSVQVDENGQYWMVFRSSNYFFNSYGDVRLTVSERVFNRLFIAKLNTESMELEESSIKELDMKRLNPQMVRGIEDARLYFDGKSWCLSATHLEKDAPRASIAVLRLKSLPDLDVLSFNVLEKPNPLRPEKNWMPIHKVGASSDCSIDFIYNYNTSISGQVFSKLSNNKDLSSFRGGTPLIPIFDDNYLAVIHETFNTGDDRFNPSDFSFTRKLRNYSHRFVVYDKNFKIIKITDPFLFRGTRVEFAAGLTTYENGYMISFGSQDVASYVATISLDNLLKQLKDLS